MTASLGNFQNGAYGSNLDGIVYPQFIFDPMRAPTTNDIFPAGTRWLDNSVSPKVIYETTGAGNWESTNTIGSATLVAGTVTVANTNIAAGDRIIAFHIDPNASTAIGTLTYTISAATSFTINSLDATASVETGDLSDVGYLIVRQI